MIIMAQEYNSAEQSDSEEDNFAEEGWVQWYCNLEGHEFITEVDEEYIRDNFNLYGLRNRIRHFK